MVSSDLRGSQIHSTANGNGHDPARDPVELASDRAHQLVGNISSEAIDQLRQARDNLDDLMRGIKARQEAVEGSIVELAQFAADAIAAKVVIADGIMSLSDRIRPKQAPTITQRPAE